MSNGVKGPFNAPRLPSATYRLQFNHLFTYHHATAILDYLHTLGVSHCYASPLFQAGPHSTHGYDICDFNTLNPALGTPDQFKALASSIRSRKMGLVLDMVPNHMGCHCSNSWWSDVLANGRGSAFAQYFDIEWVPAHTSLRNKVLLPVLEDHYAKVLEAGKLRLAFTDGAFHIAYYDNTFPVSLPSTTTLLRELIPPVFEQDVATLDQLRTLLRTRANESPEFTAAVDQLLQRYRGTEGNPATFDKLHALLQAQHYQLAYWRTGSAEINYRRFFDVTSLVSVRMENPEVFEAAHRLVFQMIAAGQVTGLRIDHPDGLWDPKTYFTRLQASGLPPLYVVAEKILTGDEELPDDWPVAGTTGYDFLNRLNGLFVARENESPLDQTYRAFTGIHHDLQTIIYAGKEQILTASLTSELAALAHRLRQLAVRSRHAVDITYDDLRAALAEVVITFPVYRTYIDDRTIVLPEAQRSYIHEALHHAKARRPDIDSAAFDFLAALLLLEPPADFDSDAKADARQFVMRFQQLSGPVMAKGLEDTAFYRFNRLVSLNEVGGDPGHFGTTIDELHAFNQRHAARWPHSLLATATHDTKRGEDVRARINVISELPDEWATAVNTWRDLNASLKREVEGRPVPSPNDEYLLYQTILGAWPTPDGDQWNTFPDRIRDYMLKAVREGKTETNWFSPNKAYEEALAAFIERILAPDSAFLKSAVDIQRRIAFFGRFNSLSQTVLKLTSPGIPDIYQGTELWDLTLVDPDNRRPVDYAFRGRLLAQELSIPAMGKLLTDDPIGQLKLHILRKLLELRRDNHESFVNASYVPLTVFGPQKNHVFAFAREMGKDSIIVLASRLLCTLLRGNLKPPIAQVWQDTHVEAPPLSSPLIDVLTGQQVEMNPSPSGRINLTDAFALLPVSVLRSK